MFNTRNRPMISAVCAEVSEKLKVNFLFQPNLRVQMKDAGKIYALLGFRTGATMLRQQRLFCNRIYFRMKLNQTLTNESYFKH